MIKIKKNLCILIISTLLFSYPFLKISHARTFSETSTGTKIGLTALSFISSLLYSPLKMTYAATGTITSGLLLVLTLGEYRNISYDLLTKTVSGDWYIHPNHILASERLDFIGPDDTIELDDTIEFDETFEVR